MTPDIPDQTGILAVVSTGMAALSAVAYKFWRQVKNDRRGDRIDDVADGLVARLQQTIESQDKRINELVNKIEASNNALMESKVEAAQLRAEVKRLLVENVRLLEQSSNTGGRAVLQQ